MLVLVLVLGLGLGFGFGLGFGLGLDGVAARSAEAAEARAASTSFSAACRRRTAAFSSSSRRFRSSASRRSAALASTSCRASSAARARACSTTARRLRSSASASTAAASSSYRLRAWDMYGTTGRHHALHASRAMQCTQVQTCVVTHPGANVSSAPGPPGGAPAHWSAAPSARAAEPRRRLRLRRVAPRTRRPRRQRWERRARCSFRGGATNCCANRARLRFTSSRVRSSSIPHFPSSCIISAAPDLRRSGPQLSPHAPSWRRARPTRASNPPRMSAHGHNSISNCVRAARTGKEQVSLFTEPTAEPAPLKAKERLLLQSLRAEGPHLQRKAATAVAARAEGAAAAPAAPRAPHRNAPVVAKVYASKAERRRAKKQARG